MLTQRFPLETRGGGSKTAVRVGDIDASDKRDTSSNSQSLVRMTDRSSRRGGGRSSSSIGNGGRVLSTRNGLKRGTDRSGGSVDGGHVGDRLSGVGRGVGLRFFCFEQRRECALMMEDAERV